MDVAENRRCCWAAFDRGLISKSDLDSCLDELDELPPATDTDCLLLLKRLVAESALDALLVDTEPETRLPGDGPASGQATLRGSDAARGRRDTTAERIFSGLIIGRYTILEKLGRGGMGAVYKAHDPDLDCHVALKLLRGGEMASPDEVQRFQREAQAVARLQHPSIVRVRDIGQYVCGWFFTMDYIEGRTLKDLIAADELSMAKALDVAVAMAHALHHAHAHGVVHRDVKPGNILIDARGKALLADFGLAKRLDSDDASTRTGIIMGTLAYLPPELARGDGTVPDGRSDIYSLGATCYEMLTGQPAFSGSTTTILAKIGAELPAAPDSVDPSIPSSLARVVLKALAKDPSRRWATAAGFARALEAERQQLTPRRLEARATAAARRFAMSRRVRWILAAAIAAAMVAALAWALLTRPSATEPDDPSTALLAPPTGTDAQQDPNGDADEGQQAKLAKSAARAAALTALAEVDLRLGNKPLSALRWASEAIGVLPNHVPARILRGEIHEALDQIAAAKEDWWHVLKLQPKNLSALFHLVCVALKHDDKAEMDRLRGHARAHALLEHLEGCIRNWHKDHRSTKA